MALCDETGNCYGKWIVISRVKPKTSPVAWICRCECGFEKPVVGAELRRGKIPICSNCCRICGKGRSETEFVKVKSLGNICISCRSDYVKDWRNSNQKHRTIYKRKWNTKSPDKIVEYRKAERQKTQSGQEIFIRRSFKIKIRLNRYRSVGRKRHIITITEDEVVALWDQQNGKCAISNMPMLYEFNNPRSISVDRIDSKLGYIPGNVQLLCRWVNLAKNNFSNEDIMDVLNEFKNDG